VKTIDRQALHEFEKAAGIFALRLPGKKCFGSQMRTAAFPRPGAFTMSGLKSGVKSKVLFRRRNTQRVAKRKQDLRLKRNSRPPASDLGSTG
jgi:hypothetical protein